jgi:hypothetical protein
MDKLNDVYLEIKPNDGWNCKDSGRVSGGGENLLATEWFFYI